MAQNLIDELIYAARFGAWLCSRAFFFRKKTFPNRARRTGEAISRE
jgi:hypothetical protein